MALHFTLHIVKELTPTQLNGRLIGLHNGMEMVIEVIAVSSAAAFRHLVRSDMLRVLFGVAIVSAPALMIAKQPDFGTAFLLLAIFFTIMMTARLRLKTLITILGLAIVAAFPILTATLATRKTRCELGLDQHLAEFATGIPASARPPPADAR